MKLQIKIFTLVISMISVVVMSQQKKVAVVTFFADKTIDLSQVDATADFVAKNTALSKDPNFNLTEALKKFHDAFFTDYVHKFPFEVVDENTIIENETYQDFTPDYKAILINHEESLYETIEGYKVIRSYNTIVKDVATMADDLGVDAIMFVYLSFDFNKTGIGKLGYYSIRAHVSIDLYSKDAKSIFQFNELAGSKKKAVMVGGIPIMSPDKIQPMCESAIESLMKDLDKKIERLSKKVGRKL